MIENKKNIILLDDNITHADLISKNIGIVLSARGSIGFQYAYFGINTVLCSDIGLYKNFNFVIKSNSLRDYTNKLEKMESLVRYEPSKEDILSFYILLNVFVYNNSNNFIFPKILGNGKFYKFQAKSENVKVFNFKKIEKHLNKKRLDNIFKRIEEFILDKKLLVLDTY